MSKPHQKHPQLARPQGDQYARTDIALVGTTCGIMDPLIQDWAQALADEYRSLAVIGDHGEELSGAIWQIGTQRFSSPFADWNAYDERMQRTIYDVALVNGNHYPAARQIVFVDPAKSGTLERRREQLTEVLAVVLCPGAAGLPEWLSADLQERSAAPVICRLEEVSEEVLPLLNNLLRTRVPALKVLLLTGGKSSRMGTRKADLVYRDGITEAQRLARLAAKIAPGAVFVSVATVDQPLVDDFPNIADRFLGMGPAGAICSAFMTDPDAAWLVLACDLPLLEEAQITKLIAARAAHQFATAYRLAGNPFPEPLVAIYEPRAYPRLLQFLGQGYACPRKLLINSAVNVLETENHQAFFNANTKEERAQVLDQLT